MKLCCCCEKPKPRSECEARNVAYNLVRDRESVLAEYTKEYIQHGKKENKGSLPRVKTLASSAVVYSTEEKQTLHTMNDMEKCVDLALDKNNQKIACASQATWIKFHGGDCAFRMIVTAPLSVEFWKTCCEHYIVRLYLLSESQQQIKLSLFSEVRLERAGTKFSNNVSSAYCIQSCTRMLLVS